jgi:hypothetical protein
MNLNHLSSMARNVTQNHGTEPPFSSPLNSNKQQGLYNCVVCNTPVFRYRYLIYVCSSNVLFLSFLVRNINSIVELVGRVFFLHTIQLVLRQNKISLYSLHERKFIVQKYEKVFKKRETYVDLVFSMTVQCTFWSCF